VANAVLLVEKHLDSIEDDSALVQVSSCPQDSDLIDNDHSSKDSSPNVTDGAPTDRSLQSQPAVQLDAACDSNSKPCGPTSGDSGLAADLAEENLLLALSLQTKGVVESRATPGPTLVEDPVQPQSQQEDQPGTYGLTISV